MDIFTLSGKNNTYLIYRFIYTPVRSNMYVYIYGDNAIIIDPHSSEELRTLLEVNGITKVNILLTHEHYDHTSGLKFLKDMYPCTLFCQRACAETIVVERKNNPALVALVLAEQDKLDEGCRYKEFKLHFEPYSYQADCIFENTIEWQICDVLIKGVSTPGHSPCSCFYFLDENIVFSGDTILKSYETIRRFKSSNELLYKQKTLPYIRSLSPCLKILPGHGDPFRLEEAEYILK